MNWFFFWSIAEAWDWLVHVPMLGFACLLILAFYIVAVGLWLNAEWQRHR